MENNHPVNELMAETIQKIRQAVDANTMVGEPLQTGEVTIIPVSKLSHLKYGADGQTLSSFSGSFSFRLSKKSPIFSTAPGIMSRMRSMLFSG